MPFGAIFGGLASGWAADYFGRYTSMYLLQCQIIFEKFQRKKAILLNNLLVVLNVGLFLMSYYIPSYVPFMIARFIVGIMNGIFTGVGTMYLSEVAPRNLRGAGTFFKLIFLLVFHLFFMLLFSRYRASTGDCHRYSNDQHCRFAIFMRTN
jgi:MFS family permease